METGTIRAGRVLLVEDEGLLNWSIRTYLSRRGYEVVAHTSGTDALEGIRGGRFDVVITDLVLEGMSGLDIAAAVREAGGETQVIIITGQGSKETVIRALREGVFDFVEKPFELALLHIAVEKAMEKNRMLRELVRLGRTDGLTGLFNQRHFYHVLEGEMKRAGRQGRPLSLILVDVDRFKEYNDRHGHLGGDEALVRIAGALRAACRRDVDIPFRYGGDEFVVVLPEADRATAREVAARICAQLDETALGLTLSIGVTELDPGTGLKAAIREADEAMYLAKQFGGNRAVTFDRAR